MIWNDNPKYIRIGTLFREPIWLAYNLYVGAYILILLQLITIVNVTLSYIKHDTDLLKKKSV